MNARWFRDNLIVLILAGVFVAILGGSFYLLKQASSHQVSVLSDLETQQGELEQLRRLKEYPSRENVDILKNDREIVKKLYALMQNAATHPPIEAPDLERDMDFTQRLRTSVEVLNQTASNQNVRTSEGFTFGFSRYISTFPCRNPVARPEDCRKLLVLLGKQLAVVQDITKILIDSHVEEISAIRRTEVEEGATGADTLNVRISNDPKALYHTYPFEMVFVCDTPQLRAVLNNFAKASSLFVVRSMRIDTVTSQVKNPNYHPPRAPSADQPEPPKFQDVPIMLEVRRLSITLRLDLLEFAPSQKPRVGKG